MIYNANSCEESVEVNYSKCKLMYVMKRFQNCCNEIYNYLRISYTYYSITDNITYSIISYYYTQLKLVMISLLRVIISYYYN